MMRWGRGDWIDLAFVMVGWTVIWLAVDVQTVWHWAMLVIGVVMCRLGMIYAVRQEREEAPDV